MASDRSNEGAGTSTPAPRLNLSELVRLQLAALSRHGGEHATVELTRNAKGDVQIRVAARTGEQGIETLEQAAELAQTIYDGLAAKYQPEKGAE